MARSASLWLVLLSAATAVAAAPHFQLGVDYSELVPTGPATQLRLFATAVDSQGDIYVLTNGIDLTCSLVKLSPGGDSVIDQNQFTAPFPNALAVDSSGNVYLALSAPSAIVEKLSPDGKTVYATFLGPNAQPSALTVDASGRVYVIGEAGGGKRSPDDAGSHAADACEPQCGRKRFRGAAEGLRRGRLCDVPGRKQPGGAGRDSPWMLRGPHLSRELPGRRLSQRLRAPIWRLPAFPILPATARAATAGATSW
jgi:hypothetical protein